jgi:integrase
MPTQYDYDHGQAVRDRQVLYWFALTTAFRANECASLLWEDLTLDGAKPCVRLAGTFTKSGTDANVPLQTSSPRLSAKCGSDAVHSK